MFKNVLLFSFMIQAMAFVPHRTEQKHILFIKEPLVIQASTLSPAYIALQNLEIEKIQKEKVINEKVFINNTVLASADPEVSQTLLQPEARPFPTPMLQPARAVSSLSSDLQDGVIEISGGLALTNPNNIEAYFQTETVKLKLDLDLENATYKRPNATTVGEIIITVKNDYGFIKGEGRATFEPSQPSPLIKVKPKKISTNIKGSNVFSNQELKSKQKFFNEIELEEASSLIQSMTERSTTAITAVSKGYRKALRLTLIGNDSYIPMFPSSVVDAFLDLINFNKQDLYDKEVPIIWGKVTREGQSLSGVQVQLETDDHIKPIYFNELLLPDTALQQTSTNGFFAFVNPLQGYHSLLALQQGEYFSHANTVVKKDHISYVELQTTMNVHSPSVLVYDAFGGNPLQAELQLQSLPNNLLVSGYQKLFLPKIKRWSMAEAAPKNPNYLPGRYFYFDDDNEVLFPLILKDWLQSLMTFNKVNIEPNTGTIVGFVKHQSNYEVKLTEVKNQSSVHIVYFNSAGENVQKSIRGGGFVVFNSPTEHQEVMLINSDQQKISVSAIPVDANHLHVLTIDNKN